MPQLDSLLIKTASRCNLDCTYCYVYQGADASWKTKPASLSDKTIASIHSRLLEFSLEQEAGFAIVLHGGEPLLLKTEKLHNLISGLRKFLPEKKYPISIQTNAGLLTKEILDFMSEHRVSLSVSLDGEKHTNDIARVDKHGSSSFESTMAGIELLRSHPDSEFLFAGTLSVIQTSTDPKRTYNFLKKIGSPNIDFLYQDGNFNKLPAGKSSFSSTEYGQWLIELFEFYISDNHPVPIRILDDLTKVIMGGYGQKEGKGLVDFGILIIETDGEIRKNDTLRASFEGVDFFEGRPNLQSHSIKEVVSSEEFSEYVKGYIPTSEICKKCDIIKFCGGGMQLYRWDSQNGFDNPSIYCKDHKCLIEHIYEKLQSLQIL